LTSIAGRTAARSDQKPKTLGEQLTTTVRAIVKANSSLGGVIDIVDFNETRSGEREISDQALRGVVEKLSDPRYRLGLHDVEPDFLARAYEYLLRKFAEGQGQSAGEFFTPQEVGWLIAYLARPRQGRRSLRLRLRLGRFANQMRARAPATRPQNLASA
jgi:type I restriction enzyme M protein